MAEENILLDPGCLTLPASLAEATDFKAEEAIKLDLSIKLPAFYSLGEWIYETSNQGKLGACTSLGTSHAVQILAVKKKGTKPTTNNIITIEWQDLRSKMGHSITKYDGGDYVERAVDIALKQGIKAKENGKEVSFDGYATQDWTKDDAGLELMKRYIYNGNPIVWCVRGDQKMWNEMSAGEVKTVPTVCTGGHCIAVVGFDDGGFWFINSWSANDADKRKSRFYVSNGIMKKLLFNWRYRVLYVKEEAKIDPERLKRINVYTTILEILKKYYNEEKSDVKNGIVALSKALRKEYPEINEKLPL